MGIAFPQCLWGIPEITAVPATIVGMLQYKSPKTDEKSQSNLRVRYKLLQIHTSSHLFFKYATGTWLKVNGLK